MDVQDFPQVESPSAHVGPPSVNVEAKLVGVDDAAVEQGADPTGKLFVRGPSVGKVYGVEDYVSIPSAGEDEGWIPTEQMARSLTNGSFHIL